MSVYIVDYAKLMFYSEQSTVLLAGKCLYTTMVFTLTGENCENLNSLLNIFHVTHDFLVMTDSVIFLSI